MMDTEPRFRALFELAYPALHRYAAHRGIGGADADDLVAATLEVAWRRLEDVPGAEPLPWLFAVARNIRRNQTRSELRRQAFVGRLPVPRPEPDPNDPAAPDAGSLRKALSQLAADDREILCLVAWDGLSPSQVAVALGCSGATARVRLHRARKRLALRLDAGNRVQRSGTSGHLPDVEACCDLGVEVPNG